MFVNSTINVGVTQRVVATLVACALVMASIGVYQTAHAANLTNVSNTLSTSEPSVASAHTILFTATNDIGPTENITITWDAQDDGDPGQDFGGISSIADNSDLLVSVNAGAGAAPTFEAATADSLEISGVTATAGQTVEIEVADTAAIINPTTLDSYEIQIDVANTENDIGRTRVVILDQVVVTAIVPTIFEFVVDGLATTTDVNGESTTGSTTPTAIPFGVLEAGTPKLMGQQLSVETNANNGFTVSVEQDGPLMSSFGADIDSFFDGTDELTPSAWASPDGQLTNGALANDDDGWGHWGLTTEDSTIHGTGPTFTGTDQYIAVLDTPTVVFGHDSVCDGTTTGGGDATTDDACLTQVGYKVEITPLQEAGDDYTTNLMYIATPRF